MRKGGQAGIEYLIIIGFITFAIISILSFAYFYINLSRDSIRINHVEKFAMQFINSAESVFFSGEPSKTVVNLYLPEGVKNIQITENMLVITTETSSGENVRAFNSKVPIQGEITPTKGIKKITFEAKKEYVLINQ
ncbi:MAG: hypothetical protein QW727_00675 [Candidatus Pacearchaeota archaeon]